MVLSHNMVIFREALYTKWHFMKNTPDKDHVVLQEMLNVSCDENCIWVHKRCLIAIKLNVPEIKAFA